MWIDHQLSYVPYQPFMTCLQRCQNAVECTMVDFINDGCDMKLYTCSDEELVDDPSSYNFLRLPLGENTCPHNRIPRNY